MTITVTPQELESFYNSLSKWNGELLNYLLKNPLPTYHGGFMEGDIVAHWRKLRVKFETEHPQPTWKDLL